MDESKQEPVVPALEPRQRAGYREAIAAYIRAHALPPDKFSHQPRLYHLATQIGQAEGQPYDEEVVYAAAWMHDLGVFVGHRPEEPAALAAWDCVAHAMEETPALLRQLGFPAAKIPAVVEAIRTHQPAAEPAAQEGWLVRDADILEQLGAVSVLRTVSKVGRDTRFVRFEEALRLLGKNLNELPGKLHFGAARRLAEPRIAALRSFLEAAQAEADGIEW